MSKTSVVSAIFSYSFSLSSQIFHWKGAVKNSVTYSIFFVGDIYLCLKELSYIKQGE